MPWLLTPLWPLSAPFSPSSRWVLGTLRVSFFTTRKSKFIASAIQYLGFIKSLPRTSILASKESGAGECRVLWPLGWPAAEFIGNLECMLRVTGASTAIMGNYSGRQKLWSWASSSSPKYWDDAARKSSNASSRLKIKNSSYQQAWLKAPRGDLFPFFFTSEKNTERQFTSRICGSFCRENFFFCLLSPLMLLLYTLMWWGSFFCCCGLRLFDFTWGEELLVSEMSLNYKSRTKFELLKS